MIPVRTSTTLAGALAVLLTGCQFGFGPTPATFDPAQGPAGVRADLRLEGGVVSGEVLEVRPDELLLLTDPPPRLVRVPLRAIRLGQFEQRRERIVRGQFPSPAEREAVRRLSRFPTGLPEDRLAALLDAYGQDAPEVLP